MLDINKDYTNIQSFELRANSMTRAVITSPPEACTRGTGSAANFFRFRLVTKRVLCQIIAWADIDTASKWADATNAFADVIGADVEQWDVVQLTSNKVMLVYQKTGEDYTRHKTYTDGTGWAAEVRQGLSQTPAQVLFGMPYFGHVDLSLSAGILATLVFRAETATGLSHISEYVFNDPAVVRGYGFYSKSPMLMVYNASGEVRFYFPLSYTVGIYGYLWHLKYGRPAGSDIAFSLAGDTVFCLENGVISQGYNPLYMRTIYSYTEMPCAKYNGVFYCHQGTKYTLTSTSLGEIKAFSQDWKRFKCIVPILGNPYTEPCTVFLRRTFNDATTLDSNPMIVESCDTTLFGNTFNCLKVIDSPAVSPLLHHLAESQPHLLFTHTLPYSPVAINNSASSVYSLLERYKLVMSHDQAALLVRTNASPVSTIAYDLYQTDQQSAKSVNLIYKNDASALVPDLIAGTQPTITHQVGFLTGNVARTTILKDYAFSFKRMTFEKAPTFYQVGDVITIDAQTGMIDDIVESFTINKWRQTLTALVA